MDPHESLLVFPDDVELVRCHVLLPSQVDLLLTLDERLTRAKDHALGILLVQLVGEMSAQASVQVLGVHEDFADEDAVQTNALLAGCVDHRAVCVAALE